MLNSLNRLRRHFRDLLDYWRAFRRNEHTQFKVIKVSTEDYLLAAKKLHADVYLYRNFVEEKDIVNGLLSPKIDPYHPHSQYFVVIDKRTGRLVATARQIYEHRGKRHRSFAMFNHTPLYRRATKLITKYDPGLCVEISGLAKHKGVSKLAPLLLYRAMWQYSLEQGHELWLLASDVRLFIRLKLLFGPAIRKAGPVTFYLGSDVVPAVLKVQSSIRFLGRAIDNAAWYQRWLRRRVARFMLKGISPELLSERERRALAKINRKYKLFKS